MLTAYSSMNNAIALDLNHNGLYPCNQTELERAYEKSRPAARQSYSGNPKHRQTDDFILN